MFKSIETGSAPDPVVIV